MFKKILVANRGEIALRVIRAAREMGIGSVAVHSTADSDAMHVRMADESVCIGPASSMESYLSIPAIIAAAEITGADAIHPGYGFLSENATFVQALQDHDINFIGPTAEHIRIMGDKISAKDTMRALGVPCVPGSEGGVPDLDAALKIGEEFDYPVIIKATAGGGGRGMKVANSAEEMPTAFSSARSEGRRPLAMTKSISKNTSPRRATSKFKYLAMAKAALCIWASEIALCNAATKKCSKRRQAPQSAQRSAHASGKSVPMRWRRSITLAPARSNFCMRRVSFISSK
jgi:biotin carboxylase